MKQDDLAARLRLIVITDAALARPRGLIEVVRAAVAAGAPAIQLRDKAAGARELAETGRVLLPIVREAGALFFVNDRLDVAIAIGADGVHVGPEDLSVGAVRRAVTGAPGTRLGAPFMVGASTDDPDRARWLAEAGADYIGCGTVYATTTKADAGPVIGIEGLKRVVEAVDVPVVGIGGIDAGRSAEIASRTHASGVAVVGAVMRAKDVGDVVRQLLAPWTR